MATIVVAIIGSNGLWAVVMYLLQRHDKKKDPEAQLLLGIAHDRIIFLCQKAVERGWTTTGEMDNITQIYTPYTALGGNGTGKAMYERYLQLPMHEEGKNED